MLDTRDFGEGVVEAWISGSPNSTASATARGFAGMALRVQDEEKLEAIYLRPTNGRALDPITPDRPRDVWRDHASTSLVSSRYPLLLSSFARSVSCVPCCFHFGGAGGCQPGGFERCGGFLSGFAFCFFRLG